MHVIIGKWVTTFWEFIIPVNISLKCLNLLFGFTSWSLFALNSSFCFSTSIWALFYSTYLERSFSLDLSTVTLEIPPISGSSSSLYSLGSSLSLESESSNFYASLVLYLLVRFFPYLSCFSPSESNSDDSSSTKSLASSNPANGAYGSEPYSTVAIAPSTIFSGCSEPSYFD